MRRLFSILALLILVFTSDSFAQYGNSRAIVNSAFNAQFVGRTCNFTEGNCGGLASGAYAGVIPCNLDGVANTPFYCLDLCTPISLSDTAKDSASTIPQAIYITNNYFPAVTNSPGRLANNSDEACAVQFAIWHFRNNVDPSTITSVAGGIDLTTFRNRVNAIIADVLANGGSSTQLSTIEIRQGVGFEDFYIETKDTAGNPIAVDSIQLVVTGSGTLSSYLVSTNGSGVSDTVTWSNAQSLDILKATGKLQVPGGITYASLRPTIEATQLLVLGRTTTGLRTTEITFGALPVELTNFASVINGRSVELSWQTSEEINNAGFEVERKSVGSETWLRMGFVQGHGTTTNSYLYSFNDRNIETGSYNYRLKQIDYSGSFEYFDLALPVLISKPKDFALGQSYPNPSNPKCNIDFQLPEKMKINISVYDLLGRLVTTLADGEREAGIYTVEFNGGGLASGTYIYRFTAGSYTEVKKLILVK